jgi:linoleate 10R-lipoxygenase
VIRQGALPDPNLIYESVMMRNEYKKHPNNVSSILWNWAAIIIHGERHHPASRSPRC